MRIISSFHDYYDIALAHGFDQSKTYVRESTAHDGDRSHSRDKPEAPWTGLPPHIASLASWASECADYDRMNTHNRDNPAPNGRQIRSVPMAFCVGATPAKALWLTITEAMDSAELEAQAKARKASGVDDPVFGELIQLYQLDDRNPPMPPAAPNLAKGRKLLFHGPAFTSEQFEQWAKPWLDQAEDDKKRGKTRYHGHSWGTNPKRTGILGQRTWLAEDRAPHDLPALMAQAACPVAAANGHGRGLENPRLADFQFYRGMDPATCIQEIAMFVSNLANVEVSTNDVPDRYRIASHGFDEQSFRKQPTKGATPVKKKRPHPDKRTP